MPLCVQCTKRWVKPDLSLDAHINRVVVENNTISVSQQKVIVPTTIGKDRVNQSILGNLVRSG